jgi:alkanesulfonate monooxygenase SsuD/methylene tetrahydromethanopterin reductase-like flavin-dependent oxidoreductase (luciferase family)
MEFNHFLSSYYPDTSYSGARLYQDMLEQARAADALGYASVSIPEHHLINILLMPAPLQMAVRVASETEHVQIVTAVAVLPLHDMRILAGEVATADILCDGRLVLGVGRGAFGYEMGRMGVPIDISREKFDESLAVLTALLTEEEVGWDGKYYKFEPLTVMPRPLTQPMPHMMIAVMSPAGIYACAKRGLHVQTTPLQGTNEYMLEQAEAFQRGKAERGETGEHLQFSLLRVAWPAKDERDKQSKLQLTNGYYERFDNVFTGPGEVSHGAIKPLPATRSIEELAENTLVCTRDEMIDRLGMYADAGIDEVALNFNIGAGQEETLEAMHRFADEIIPRFTKLKRRAA